MGAPRHVPPRMAVKQWRIANAASFRILRSLGLFASLGFSFTAFYHATMIITPRDPFPWMPFAFAAALILSMFPFSHFVMMHHENALIDAADNDWDVVTEK